MTNVYIAESAWKTIIGEVKYFAAMKNKEAIVYPTFGFLRSPDCMKAPWDVLELEDIDCFVVTHAHAPIRNFCAHTGVRAKYSFANEAERKIFQDDVDQWSEPLCSKYPSLELGNVHSHPFAFLRTWPSSGGPTMDYARIYDLWERMLSRKVNTPLEIILCRKFLYFNSWTACCFGFDAKQKIRSLGKAKVISDESKIVRKILTNPYYKTTSGRRWEQSEREKCAGLETVDRFYFGWSAARLKINDTLYAYVNLPLQFPDVEAVLYNTLDVSTRKWSKMQKYFLDGRGYVFSLMDVVKKIQEGGLNGQS